jgi:hypothetical protein
MLFVGLATVAAFLLGLRVGFTLGHRNAERQVGGRKRDPAGPGV